MAIVTAVRCVRTRHDGSWTIVRVETDQPGLVGIGSASDAFNPGAVVTTVEQLLGPLLVGRDSADIEDIWQTLYTAGYWRNGSITSTALGGVDVALWDIKAKEAGMPLYQLLGGRARTVVPCYAHATGATVDELGDDIQRYADDGWPVIRAQLGGYGGGGFTAPGPTTAGRPAWSSHAFDEELYLRSTVEMFAALRERLGRSVELTHDVHSHLSPQTAVRLASELQPFGLFFVEDILPPEHLTWYRNIRQVATTPMAVGELFGHPLEWRTLISEQLIDFIRVRVSNIGGITPARKLAALAEAFGVRTAWQEGADNDPVNLAASVALDLSQWSFGVQEENDFTEAERAAFVGAPVVEHGYIHPGAAPGLGVELDEGRAAGLLTADPDRYHRPYGTDRRADGSAVRP